MRTRGSIVNLYRRDRVEGTQPTNGQGGPHHFMGRHVIGEAGWRKVRQRVGMSQREFQIAQLLFDDKNEQEIAGALGISPHTVHTHLERLYRKTGVSSRVQLVVYVFSEYIDANDPPSIDRN